MPDTSGFEVVGQLSVGVLQQILEAAWDNNVIPHSVEVSSGLAYGPYQVRQGVINIPREGLGVAMAPADNGVTLILGSEIQIEIANPPLPGLTFFDMAADVSVTAAVAKLPGTTDVAIMLGDVQRDKVSAVLTSGDPVPPITLDLISEYVHQQYTNGTIPAFQSQEDVGFIGFTADVWVDIYDDPAAPSRRIEVLQPAADQVKLRIPIHLRLSNVEGGGGLPVPSPMGVVARLAITADLDIAPGSISVGLAGADVAVEDFAPAPPSDGPIDYDDEGANYSTAVTFYPPLEGALRTRLEQQAATIVAAVGDFSVVVPTVAQIESFIADQAHTAVTAEGNINVWTPEAPAGSDITITDVVPKALADALAFGINPMAGANADGITNFIPADRSCGVALHGQLVIDMIWEQIRRPESEGGFGPDFPPHTFSNVDGHDARLNDLDISLREGAIHMEGDVTVIDAVLGCIDVDADFSADAGLRWEDNPDGTQRLEPFVIGEPDVDLSLLAWILSFLIGFITFGLVGGIIVVVALFIIEGIAERVGGAVVRDEVTDEVRGISAWPQTIRGVGEVVARFENPVVIDADGILFPDAYDVTALLASVTKASARANGPYVGDGGVPVAFSGGPIKPHTTYLWELGDGITANSPTASRTYGDDGIYVSRFTSSVTAEGGVATRHLAMVRVRNLPAVVDAGPDIVINEGEEVEVVAAFHDNEWLDTHVAVFDWGDDTLPVRVEVDETNEPPRAVGTARARHAYCDNGDYTLTVRVLDDDGGLGADTKRITVLNVAPTVDAGRDVYAYPCTPITLRACFYDPGWCDTHTGTWDFGDCTPPLPAVISEKHEPPAGVGYAAAAHIYAHCGTFYATVTVEDDDGGVGEDAILVRVTDVQNKDFERGFRNVRFGTVANEWEPYVIGAGRPAASAGGAGTSFFRPEQFRVRGGRRSQRIDSLGAERAGIYQRVGANPGWDYQVKACFHIDENTAGTCRLGVDPDGDADLTSPRLVWAERGETGSWLYLVVRVTTGPDAEAITIFLETTGDRGGASTYFDHVELIAYPCQIGECELPEAPEPEERVCVDWRDEREPRDLGTQYEKDGFIFKTVDPGNPMRIVFFGPPTGGMLYIPPRGLRVTLPFLADAVAARVISHTSKPIRIEAVDTGGNAAGSAVTAPNTSGTVQSLAIAASGIATLHIRDGGGEGALIELCISRNGSFAASGGAERRRRPEH